jgi:acyl-CoA hydrolase
LQDVACPRTLSLADAVALVRPHDTLALGFGPAEATPFLEVMAARDDWTDLLVYGGSSPSRSRSFGAPASTSARSSWAPASALRDAGADVQFVPSDFRRFARALRRVNPRVLVTTCTPPDRDGWMSLGSSPPSRPRELHRYARDPERLLIVLTNPLLRGRPGSRRSIRTASTSTR